MPNVSPPAVKSNPVGDVGHPVLVGFSVRSLVEAVTAFGWYPVAVDHFTDQDCRELAYAYYQVEKWGGKPPDFDQILVEKPHANKLDNTAAHLLSYRADIRAKQSELGEKRSLIEPSFPSELSIPELKSFPKSLHIPWVLLGGGTENWPELVANLHQNFNVLGPTPNQLTTLRSYRFWRQTITSTGIRFPPSLSRPTPHFVARLSES